MEQGRPSGERAFYWDAICITARTPAHAEAYKQELVRRRGGAALSHSALILAASDPGPNEFDAGCTDGRGRIGSGGATLNALLLVAEHLSALAGANTVDMDILEGKLILVLHVGGTNQRIPAYSLLPPPANPSIGDSEGSAFSSSSSSSSSSAHAVTSTIELLLQGLLSLAHDCPPGLFVVSSEDSFLRLGKPLAQRFAATASAPLRSPQGIGRATAISTLSPLSEVAGRHGAYQLGEGNEVRRLLYRASAADLKALVTSPEHSDSVAKVCGIVFFDDRAATRLLQLAFEPLFESCSYLGIDNGAEPAGFSLHLDLLACLGTDVGLEEFANGEATQPLGQVSVKKELRAELHRRFHGHIELQAVLVSEGDSDRSDYLSVRSVRDYARLMPIFGKFQETPNIGGEPCVVNSILQACDVGAGAVVENCSLEKCIIAEGAVCSGLKRHSGVRVEKNLSVQEVTLLPDARRRGHRCITTYALGDESTWEIPNGTFLGRSWEDLERRTGITAAMLWGDDAASATRSLRSARLFPVEDESVALQPALSLLWVEYEAACTSARSAAPVDLWRRRWLQAWTEAQRLSLEEVTLYADIAAELRWQDDVAAESNVLMARDLLLHHPDRPLANILDDEVRRGSRGLFDVFDEVALDEATSQNLLARSLSMTAELLARFAGPAGGLRSGSARHPRWRGALQRLASPDAKRRRAAVEELQKLRTEWLEDGAVALMRAARHYEAASQMVILSAVGTCAEFIRIEKNSNPTPSGQWVTVEAPARIDLAGGWSDTPPLCYEHGGAVVNIAILVDGKRPLGAKARRLDGKPMLIFQTLKGKNCPPEDAQPVECHSLRDLDDHDKPGAAAALLKCCILVAGIVSLDPAAGSLEQQLLAGGGAGLEVCSWSELPQGSGLGSSSILAGVVIKAVLLAFGKNMDEESLIHAVQNVEQMLTTGGGWQDQVGALLGGAKVTRSAPQLPLHVVPEPIRLNSEFARQLESRILLIFTGRPRLAKHLLQTVIRQWFSRVPEICRTVRQLVANAEDAAVALQQGQLTSVGQCLSNYWEQKKVMAPGSEPTGVAELRTKLQSSLLGFSLAGAGGGGFAVLITKEPDQLQHVQEVMAACKDLGNAYVCQAQLDFEGMVVSHE